MVILDIGVIMVLEKRFRNLEYFMILEWGVFRNIVFYVFLVREERIREYLEFRVFLEKYGIEDLEIFEILGEVVGGVFYKFLNLEVFLFLSKKGF